MNNDIPVWKRVLYIVNTIVIYFFVGYLIYTVGNLWL